MVCYGCFDVAAWRCACFDAFDDCCKQCAVLGGFVDCDGYGYDADGDYGYFDKLHFGMFSL